MITKLFDDIPGVGEILMYQIDETIGEKRHWLKHRNNNLWLDNLAFKQLEVGRPISFSEFETCCGRDLLSKAIDLPFLQIKDRCIFYSSEKYLNAGLLIPIYEAIYTKTDLKKLTSLIPYDLINYIRPVIETNDDELLKRGIENSNNNHYIRFLFLLLRRCGTEGNEPWRSWIENYIKKLPNEINSYSEFTVQRDSRVTFTSIAGKEVLFSFVNRMIEDEKLQQWERRHFIESLGTVQRSGEVLYWKIVEAGYRQQIAPINIFSIHFFPSKKIKRLLERISNENNSKEIRKISRIALQLMK